MYLTNLDDSLPTTMVMGISEIEELSLQDLSGFINNPKIYLYPFFEDSNNFSSPEGVNYQKFKLCIIYDGEDFTQELSYPANEIVIYTIDGLVFFSYEYAEVLANNTEDESVIIIDPIDSN